MSTYHYNGAEWTTGSGSGSDTQGRYTVRRNNLANIQQMLAVGASYIGSGLAYGQVTVFDRDNIIYDSIDCSAFVMLTLMGISFEDSPYTTRVPIVRNSWEANSDYPWALNICMYKKSTYADGHASDQLIRNAAAIGRFFYDRNAVVPMTNGFRDVEPGDVVLYAKKTDGGDWYMPDRWMHISHIEIIANKTPAPDTYVDVNGVTQNWDKSRYPFRHGIMGARGSQDTIWGPDKVFLEQGMEDATLVTKNNCNTACLIVRPDLGALAGIEAQT